MLTFIIILIVLLPFALLTPVIKNFVSPDELDKMGIYHGYSHN